MSHSAELIDCETNKGAVNVAITKTMQRQPNIDQIIIIYMDDKGMVGLMGNMSPIAAIQYLSKCVRDVTEDAHMITKGNG